MKFRNRPEAGRLLAEQLQPLRADAPIVLGLPRGGVEVAAPIAEGLDAPLDVLVVRKLGAPHQPELAIGAVTDGERPVVVLNDRVIDLMGVSREYIEEETERQLARVREQQARFRLTDAPPAITGRTVIVIDDGIATGGTLRAAIKLLHTLKPAQLVAAIPVAPPRSVKAIRKEVDALHCLLAPPQFHAVGQYYEDFRQTSDARVIELLSCAADRCAAREA